MKEILSLIRNDKILNRFYLASLGLIGITILYILFIFKNLPPVIPMFNQLPWGEERLGPAISIFLPDIIVGTIFILNLILSGLFYSRTPLISRILAVTCFLIALLTFLFIFRTTQIVL